MADEHVAIAHPAATVVLLRDGAEGCEVLLVRRNARLAFHGGAWVFPGGRIDVGDWAGDGDVLAAARRAAVREAREEAGVEVDPALLVPLSRWVTPVEAPKRFDTWFFAAPAHAVEVQVDGGEIHAHEWMRPAAAIAAHQRQRIELPPPTFVTLTSLSAYRTVDEVLHGVSRPEVPAFFPRLRFVAEGACTVYAGDVAYDSGELDAPGPRHRLWMVESGWRYERSDAPVAIVEET